MIDRLVASPVVLQLVLLAAVTARLDILLVVDKAGEPWRRIMRRLGPWGRYLSGCPWCVGIWLSAAVVAGWVNFTGPTLLVGTAAGCALAAGYMGAWLKESLPPPPE